MHDFAIEIPSLYSEKPHLDFVDEICNPSCGNIMYDFANAISKPTSEKLHLEFINEIYDSSYENVMDDFVIEVFKPSTEKPTDFAGKGLMKFYLCDGNFCY